MAEKTLNTRITHKNDTQANWEKATNFIPKEGEIIIYNIDANHTAPRAKIGDGATYINNLPFMTVEPITDDEIDAICNVS